jgi:hypothetical protein
MRRLARDFGAGGEKMRRVATALGVTECHIKGSVPNAYVSAGDSAFGGRPNALKACR